MKENYAQQRCLYRMRKSMHRDALQLYIGRNEDRLGNVYDTWDEKPTAVWSEKDDNTA